LPFEKLMTRPALRGWRRSGALAVACLLLLTASGRFGFSADETLPDGWNVVLISIDTLRADRLSLYGYERDTTPFLQEFAKSAVVFENPSHNGGGTLPSHMSMLTSLNPMTHRVYPKKKMLLENERITLAEQLKQGGYATGAFTDGGWVRAKFGFDQGFDVYDDEGGHFEKILPKAKAWVEKNKREKFFLFLHTYDVHTDYKTPMPYSCPGDAHLRYVDPGAVSFDGCRFDKCSANLLLYVNSRIRSGEWTISSAFSNEEVEFLSSTYDGCIRYVDDQISEFFELLVELGLYEKTLIVITSDHGEEFAEHGMLLHQQPGFETLTAVPLIFRFPGGAHGGRRVEAMASIIDIMPTVLEFLDLEVNGDAQGVSLLPAITTGAVVREQVHMFDVVKLGRWKYFRSKKRLFDLIEDPGEQNNIYDEHPEVVEALRRRVHELESADLRAYQHFVASVKESNENVTLSKEETENLRSLGYLN
jgi:arylsulfatase A-like enzyme